MESGGTGREERLLDIGRGGIVTAKGTANGLIIRLDSRVDPDGLKLAVSEFVEPRKSFLSGNDVKLEWVGGEPAGGVVESLTAFLKDDFNIGVKSGASDLKDPASVKTIDVELGRGTDERGSGFIPAPKVDPASQEGEAGIAAKSLFDGIGDARGDVDSVVDPAAWDDADARIVYTTLHSGQKIETEHSLIVVGDVNPGAELVAGGDIIVLGSLRGIAHAGAYDESGGGRIIFALDMRPTQLRIGVNISRGSTERGKSPEIARIDGDSILVEPFRSKSGWFRRWI